MYIADPHGTPRGCDPFPLAEDNLNVTNGYAHKIHSRATWLDRAYFAAFGRYMPQRAGEERFQSAQHVAEKLF